MMTDGDAEPTMQLRFQARAIVVTNASGSQDEAVKYILQQRWRVTDLNAGLEAPYQRYEWRDVPLASD